MTCSGGSRDDLCSQAYFGLLSPHGMRQPIDQIVIVPLEIFLLALISVVSFKLLTGSIRTRGLLRDPLTGRTSALKTQKLVATLAFAGGYAAAIAGRAPKQGLPPVNAELLALVGGSNALVLISQGLRYLRGPRRPTHSDLGNT